MDVQTHCLKCSRTLASAGTLLSSRLWLRAYEHRIFTRTPAVQQTRQGMPDSWQCLQARECGWHDPLASDKVPLYLKERWTWRVHSALPVILQACSSRPKQHHTSRSQTRLWLTSYRAIISLRKDARFSTLLKQHCDCHCAQIKAAGACPGHNISLLAPESPGLQLFGILSQPDQSTCRAQDLSGAALTESQ